MPYCIVQGCPSGSVHQEEGVILHVFPPKKETIYLWLSKINQDFGNVDEFVEKVLQGKKSDKYRICSKHFSPESYYPFDVYKKRLRPDAVPNIFEQLSPAPPANQKRRVKRRRTEDSDSLEEPGSSLVCRHCKQNIQPKPMNRLAKVSYIGKKDSMTQTDPKMVAQEPSKWDIQLAHIYEDGDFQRTPLPFPSRNVTVEPSGPVVKQEASSEVAMRDSTVGFSPFTVQAHETTPNALQETLTTNLGSHGCTKRVINSATDYRDFSTEIKEEVCGTQNHNLSEMLLSSKSGDVTYDDYVQERKFIVFESCLDALFKKMNCQKVSSCNQPIVHVEKERIGSAISVYGTCARNHRQHLWQSQPKIGNVPVGNLLLSSAILCSGSSYLKTERFLNLLGVLHLDKSTYYTNQETYLYPALNQIWEDEQQRLFAQVGNMPVCVAGDGLCDSRGRKAKYCVYSLMDVHSKKILMYNVEQLQPGYTSVGLRKIACNRAIQFLIDSYVNVQMLCTGRHAGIRKIMKEKFGGIIHKFDIWHLAKAIGKKLLLASRKRNCSELANWVIPIKTHLWWCATTCEENTDLLVEKWNSLIHHVINDHSWNFAGQYKSCAHHELSDTVNRRRKWIRADSIAHKNLKQIVLNRKLQKDLRHLSYFCHPGEFEVFHSAVQKYRPKRIVFGVDEMIARIQLSVLDYNNNVHRVQELAKRQTRFVHPVGTSRFKTAYRMARKEPGNQEFIFSVIRQVLHFASGTL
ncbi:uncharacterized protein LOC122921497 [Bufo gargarizans]|uniref:uncharacterized protein LOC122921497 n=1 Tax=Bufo gargarizans TaxID=30331 RepID=UPI001CF5169E|nr:uncharacterized protein LOC122921497 [Bufo gargarizans]